jgi:AraC family transcriptional regulator
MKRLQVEGFTVSETGYNPRSAVPVHSHAHAFFYTVLEGDYTDVFGSRSLAVGGPSVVFHPSGESHSHHTGDCPTRCFNVDVGPRWMAKARDYGVALEEPFEIRGASVTSLTARLYREFQAPDPAAALAIEALSLEILVECSRRAVPPPERTPPGWLGRARNLIHDGFQEKLTLETIAGEVGVHPVHLARAFRQHFRCTVGDYVRELRVAHACRQIAETDVPLVEIALAAGFGDQSQFTRVFKRVVGMTPARFRAAARSR